MLPAHETRGHVRLTTSGPRQVGPNTQFIQLDNGVKAESTFLQEFCNDNDDDFGLDLGALVTGVKYIDRAVRRNTRISWSRTLTVTVPVIELARWKRPEAMSSLAECLNYLTGDDWHFKFVQRKRPNSRVAQLRAPLQSNVRHTFVPSSHGLDSYAQMRLLKARCPTLQIAAVHVDSRKFRAQWGTYRARGRHNGRVQTLPVGAYTTTPRHPEPSFRSRAFVFAMFAAYGALMSKDSDVMIPENGQGSLGGSLARLGAEAPHRSCHPGFTTRLRAFLMQLTGKSVEFVHPALFDTKAQVFAALRNVEPNTDAWLKAHTSCSYDSRHANKAGRQVHCGVCGNCLLRRMSTHAAGIPDPTVYAIESLQAATLDAADKNSDIRAMDAYKDLAFNSVRSMQRLADLAGDMNCPHVLREVAGLARYQGREYAATRADVHRLLEAHRSEWEQFVTDTGDGSWVAAIARG